jgi:hypothetical protein
MGVDERARHELYRQLERVVGKDATDTLMAYLPPTGCADVATTEDVRSAIAELRGEMHHEFGQVRGEIGELRGEIGREIGELRGEIGREIGGLCGEMHAVTRNVVFSVIGAQAAMAALVLALSRLGG